MEEKIFWQERITNINEIEKLIESIVTLNSCILEELKKENPSYMVVNGFSNSIKEIQEQLKNFEFTVEIRKVHYCE